MRVLRVIRLLVIVLICGSPSAAQTSAQHGIQTNDLDKKCDPCTDFAQYANGSGHAQNPIPAYMDRWSRRWQAGEEAKDHLKVILEEIRALQKECFFHVLFHADARKVEEVCPSGPQTDKCRRILPSRTSTVDIACRDS